MITAISSMTAFNTVRKDGFFPQSSPLLFAGEIREREQAVIYQQPAGTRERGQHRTRINPGCLKNHSR